MNSKISLRLDSLSIDQLIEFVTTVINSVNTSPYLGGVVPTAALETARDDAQAALEDRNTKRSATLSATEVMVDKLEDMAKELKKVAKDTEEVADGNTAILESGGFNTYEPGKAFPLGQLPAPQNLLAIPGMVSETVTLSWLPVYGNRGYQVYITTNPLNSNSWKKSVYAPNSGVTINGLTTGTKYWFYVVALGSAGEGVPSDETSSVAR